MGCCRYISRRVDGKGPFHKTGRVASCVRTPSADLVSGEMRIYNTTLTKNLLGGARPNYFTIHCRMLHTLVSSIHRLRPRFLSLPAIRCVGTTSRAGQGVRSVTTTKTTNRTDRGSPVPARGFSAAPLGLSDSPDYHDYYDYYQAPQSVLVAQVDPSHQLVPVYSDDCRVIHCPELREKSRLWRESRQRGKGRAQGRRQV